MTIYTGSQAQAIIRQGKYPINSIGVTRCTQGYAYWFWDGWTFDSGVESTEEKALRTAKKNWRSTKKKVNRTVALIILLFIQIALLIAIIQSWLVTI
jgi:hypothetical protein